MIDEYKFYRLFTYIGSLFLITVLLISFPNSKDRLIDQTIRDFTRNTFNNETIEDDKLYIFSKPHTQMYVTAYNIFLDNKFIGVGPRQFRNECENYRVGEYSCETHPHNTYIQILSETGIIGFLFLISILFYFLKNVFKHLILRIKGKYLFTDLEVCILSAVAMYLWPFVPTGNIFNNWLNIIMIINLPFLIWAKALKKL